MPVREPAVAGQFYPENPGACLSEIRQYVSGAGADAVRQVDLSRIIAGIVPHAGWICSGAVAAEVIRLLAQDASVHTYVIFGAVHQPTGPFACVYTGQAWRTPLGHVPVDDELARAVTAESKLLILDAVAHEEEHSIEVEVPFIQHLAPSARLLPVLVPPTAMAHRVGIEVANRAVALNRRVVFLGSTDLTHYGPRYRFTPHGATPEGIRWAKEVNDQRMLDLATALQADKIVGEALANRNACGSGALAATIAAARQLGADAARLVRHTSSFDVLYGRLGPMQDSVGYAGVVFGTDGRV